MGVIRQLRLLVGSVFLVILLALIDLLNHHSQDPVILGIWSKSIFLIFLGLAAVALVTGALLIWLIWEKVKNLISVTDKLLEWLARPPVYVLLGLTGILAVGVLWYVQFQPPFWRSLLWLLTFAILLIFGGLISLGLTHKSFHPEKLYTPTLVVASLYIVVQLIHSILFTASNVDEAARAYIGSRLWTGDLPVIYMPLEFYPLGILLKLFGPSFAMSRVISALLGVIGAALLYFVTKFYGGKWAGLTALILLAVSNSIVRCLSLSFPYALMMIWLMALLAAVSFKVGWVRVAVVSVIAGLVVLTRHHMLLTPIIVAIYFVVKEPPRDWLIGGIIAILAILVIMIPFYPDLKYFIELSTDSVSGRMGTESDWHLLGESLMLTAIGNFVLVAAGIVVLVLAINYGRKNGWPTPKPWLKDHHIVILAIALFIASFILSLPSPIGLNRTGRALVLYFPFFASLLIFALGLLVTQLWPHIQISGARHPFFLGWLVLCIAIIGTGRQMVYPWPAFSKSILPEVKSVSVALDQLAGPDDRVLFLAPILPPIELADVSTYSNAAWLYNGYLDAETSYPGDSSRRLLSYNQMQEWLGKDATVVVLDDHIFQYNQFIRDESFRQLIEDNLEAHFELIESIPLKNAWTREGGPTTIYLYRRISDDNSS